MNKYLKTYKEIENLASNKLNEPSYCAITKCLIANECESILDWDEYNNIQLTEEQQEKLIDIIYDFAIDLEEDNGTFKPTYAVTKTLAEYGNYFDFIGEYETNFSKIYDKFIWKL